jgi:signal transduction histidine kinase
MRTGTGSRTYRVHRAVHALRRPTLVELGLVPALRETAARYEGDGLRICVEALEEMPPLPAVVGVAAYRIAQEAIINAVRHAGASRCSVRFDLDEARVRKLQVADRTQAALRAREAGLGEDRTLP